MRNPKFRIACLGAGYFSKFQIESWGRIGEVDLVGIANRDIKKAEAFGYPSFENNKDMLSETRPDILDIITPPETHLTAIKEAIAYNVKAIICQKPFCTSLDEAKRAIQLAKDADMPLIIHENFRFQPWFRIIKTAINEGRIGRLHQVTFRMRTGDGQGADAYLARQPYFQKMERFLVHETGVHYIDTFRYLMGDIRAVYADLRKMNPVIAGEDAGHVIFDFADGVRAIYDADRNLDHATDNTRRTFGEALVEGTLGTITLEGDGVVKLRKFGSEDYEVLLEAQDWPGFAGDCVHALQSHVIEGLSGRAVIENLADDYLKVVETEAAIYQSAAEGRKITIKH